MSIIGSTKWKILNHQLVWLISLRSTTIGVYCIYPDAATYYFVGGVLHLLFDMLNNPFNNHGVWLLYPIKTGKGIALGICKAARTGNKVCYFAGIILFVGMSAFYFWRIGDVMKVIALAVVLTYMVVAMHFVRQKSETSATTESMAFCDSWQVMG